MLKFFSNISKAIFKSSNSAYLDAVKHKSIYLPSAEVRFNQGLSDNIEYLNETLKQIKTLKENCNLEESNTILDFGCGQGRFANGLIHSGFKPLKYIGIDAHKVSIQWCNRFIHKYYNNFEFVHINAHNARYNSTGTRLQKIPLKDNSAQLAFLNSVFSHMLSEDVKFYLDELNRIIVKNGYLYFTAFIENNVADVEENPIDYLKEYGESTGPLHRVRYNYDFLISILNKAGFKGIQFYHREIKRTGQSVIICQVNN
jgi:SAM-dependent methyltransferase